MSTHNYKICNVVYCNRKTQVGVQNGVGTLYCCLLLQCHTCLLSHSPLHPHPHHSPHPLTAYPAQCESKWEWEFHIEVEYEASYTPTTHTDSSMLPPTVQQVPCEASQLHCWFHLHIVPHQDKSWSMCMATQ